MVPLNEIVLKKSDLVRKIPVHLSEPSNIRERVPLRERQ